MISLMSSKDAATCGVPTHVPMSPELVDFSGPGMWRVYKFCMQYNWKIETGLDDVEAGQVVYHAIFGTQNEDLGILQQVTNVTSPWKLRSQIAGKFRSAGKKLVNFNIPNQVLYAKMAQANMTGLLTESSYQVRSKQVFAGVRTVKYIDSFYKHMETENNSMMQGGLTLPALTMFYRQLKSIRDLDGTKVGSVSNIEIRETGRYFCGRDN